MLITAMFIGILLGSSAAVITLLSGLPFWIAILAYSLVGSLGMIVPAIWSMARQNLETDADAATPTRDEPVSVTVSS